MPEKLKSRASITEQTADWRAGCGRSARPVRRGERGESPVPTSIAAWLRASGRRPCVPRPAARAKWLPMLRECAGLGARRIHFRMGAAAGGAQSRSAARRRSYAAWLRASGRRPCVPRPAARANGWTMLSECAGLGGRRIHFRMGAAAGGVQSRPAARRRSYAAWLRASGRRPCVPRPAARAKGQPMRRDFSWRLHSPRMSTAARGRQPVRTPNTRCSHKIF